MARPRAAALATALAFAAAGAALPAQDDLRDIVRTKAGKELRGRIAEPHAAGELVLLQGGRRVRVPRADVASIDRVGDRVRAFLEQRQKLREQPRAQWLLVEWAQSHDLPGLARLQAMAVCLASYDERAHAFLGHKQRNKTWLWEHDGKWLTQEQLAIAIVRDPIALPGERFAVHGDADLATLIAAAFDLERTAVYFYETFGDDLQPAEVLKPIRAVVHRDAVDFPKWGFRAIPYFVPDPHGDTAHTFLAGASPPRPQKLAFVGAQALLYHTLIGSVALRDERDRVCPWLEIGLPMLIEQSLAGDPGYAVAGPPRAVDLLALQAKAADYRLSHLLHLPMYGGFYLMDDTPTAIHWSAAAMLVQYLLQPDNVPQTRAAFLAYIRSALGERRGDSSSVFDAAMGRRIEDFEAPFRNWLEKVAAK